MAPQRPQASFSARQNIQAFHLELEGFKALRKAFFARLLASIHVSLPVSDTLLPTGFYTNDVRLQGRIIQTLRKRSAKKPHSGAYRRTAVDHLAIPVKRSSVDSDIDPWPKNTSTQVDGDSECEQCCCMVASRYFVVCSARTFLALSSISARAVSEKNSPCDYHAIVHNRVKPAG